LKSFDIKTGESMGTELNEVPVETENSVNPLEITQVEDEVQDLEANAATEEAEAETQAVAVGAEPQVTTSYPSKAQKAAILPPISHIDDEKVTPSRVVGSKKFSWFSHARFLAWTPYGIVILLGAILRFWDLGAKPLHHDESLHAYFSLGLLRNLQHWGWCVGWNNPPANYSCYTYDPLLHGPFQFHAIALVYQISQWLGAPDNGVNTTTVRIMAALLGTALLFLPYFLRDYLGKLGAWLATFLLAVSPSMVYFSRFAREDIYMAFFTLLLVVAIGRYMRERKMSWLLLAAAGFALSYATSEATFLTIAVFGSFLGALIVWEIGVKFPLRELLRDQQTARFLPRTFGGPAVLLYFIIVGIAAKIFFAALDSLSTYINQNTAVANINLTHLEENTVRIIPWLGILLGLYVFSILAREIYGKLPPPGRHGLARFVDRRHQPVLDAILTMPWTHWFFALILGWAIFLVLFTVVFTNLAGGIGDGIWKGLYYWLEQQNVARGGQPWYYYLLVIPLYEQIGVVFAVVGIIYIALHPNRFRLFLVYWFLGNFFIYSWAGEKMPWLTVFMTMPMMLLAAVGLEPCVLACYHFVRERFFHRAVQPAVGEQTKPNQPIQAPPTYPRIGVGRFALASFGVVMAVLLLIPTIQNMRELSYIHPADGPHEMLVYVQTTNDVNAVMSRIDAIDQKNFGGQHQMRIGVTADATWPFAWYLHDYPNLCFGYPDNCPTWKDNVPVVIAGGDDPYGYISNFAPANGNYLYHEYHMRSWWDEGYKLPPCSPNQKPGFVCSNPNLGSGVGPGLWLSYGDTPPPGAQFNLGQSLQRIWNWWWYRQPFGGTDGAYDMELFVQKGLGVNP
jgi:uncharacterized protein (TIGR03663 family)